MFDYSHLTLAQAATPDLPPTAPGESAAPAVSTNGTTAAPPPAASQPGTGKANQPSPWGGMLLPMIAIVVLMYFMLFRQPQKEKKRREALLSALKKGDRVLTVGGMIGTIVEMNDNEVILRFDDNTNARAKFTRMAIQSVVEPRGGDKADKNDKADKAE
jgi:preprotein translocase subunit YajC